MGLSRMMTAEEWNEVYPVGTEVTYWLVKGEPKKVRSKTRSKAWTLGSGDPVVKIEGRAGGIALDHLEPGHGST